jgi:hypothetical protein
MNYVPAELMRPAKLKDVVGPAIVLPEPGREDAFLVTGGERPYVCFIGGRYAGDGFLQEKASRWSGLAIEPVRFEVDPSSAFKPALIEQPLVALIRAGTEILIFFGSTDTHGFKDAMKVPVFGQLSVASADAEVGFRRWRAVVGEGANSIAVFTFEATKTANA